MTVHPAARCAGSQHCLAIRAFDCRLTLPPPPFPQVFSEPVEGGSRMSFVMEERFAGEYFLVFCPVAPSLSPARSLD